MSGRLGIILGALFGALGVAAGAFGAHALRGAIDARSLEIWQTAAHYQQVHAVVILTLGIWTLSEPRPRRSIALALFCVGVLIFSGTLYAVALGAPRALGAVTPIGGVCLIAGWTTLLAEGLTLPRRGSA